MTIRIGPALPWAILAIPVAAGESRQELVFDTDATLDTARMATCIARTVGDPRACIRVEATACRDRPSTAASSTGAGIRCDGVEMNFWQGLLDRTVLRLTTELLGTSRAAFTARQDPWETSAMSVCSVPFDFIFARLVSWGDATGGALRQLAGCALSAKIWVQDYRDRCALPQKDMRPGFSCKQ